MPQSNILMYTTEDGVTKIEVTFDQDTVWLSIDQMAELFQRDKSVIGKHIRNIFKEGELIKEAVWAKFAYTASDGKTYQVDFYNLDVIISVGYRVKSLRGTQFRIWATSILKEYMKKGFALDLYNGEIISYNISLHPVFAQITDMLDKAFEKIPDDTFLVLHSDQGWQYQMERYQERLKTKGIIQSMSRKGNCLDNAVMENFFGLLKTEMFYKNEFESTEHLINEIEKYIDYYNNKRIKSRLNGMSPVQYRIQSYIAA